MDSGKSAAFPQSHFHLSSNPPTSPPLPDVPQSSVTSVASWCDFCFGFLDDIGLRIEELQSIKNFNKFVTNPCRIYT